jgi:hypothetical protein
MKLKNLPMLGYAVLLMSLSLSASAARAEDDAPTPSPLPAPIVAELTISGGLVPPGYPIFHGVRLQADGTATAFRDSHVEWLGQLSDTVMARVQSSISRIRPGVPLIDLQPGLPPCYDAPTRNYTVTGAAGTLLITQWRACHTFVLQDGSGNFMTRALEGLYSLSTGR